MKSLYLSLVNKDEYMDIKSFICFGAFLLLSAMNSHAQIIVGDAPEVEPEFTLIPQDVRDTLIVEDTFRYEGQWPVGEGVLYDVNRGMIFGRFSGAVPDGYCTAYFVDGGRYQGEMKDGKENGYGHYFSKSGKVFAGKFENDRAHGVDTLYYPDGRVFIGVVVKGRELDHGEKYESIPAHLEGRKPVFVERDLTEEQRMWIAENHYVAPLFKGQSPSSGAFTRWVNGKLKYPKEMRSAGWQGAVRVRFFVEADGSIKDVEVLKCEHESFAKEAVKVITSSPKWTPGYRGGKPVRVYYDFTVNFLQRY